MPVSQQAIGRLSKRYYDDTFPHSRFSFFGPNGECSRGKRQQTVGKQQAPCEQERSGNKNDQNSIEERNFRNILLTLPETSYQANELLPLQARGGAGYTHSLKLSGRLLLVPFLCSLQYIYVYFAAAIQQHVSLIIVVKI